MCARECSGKRRANATPLTVSPRDVSSSSFSIVLFLLEQEEHFPCGLGGFHEQADGENTVDIKLFLFKGIVVTRWSSRHSK